MNAPYFREFFNSYISIHAKTMKELNRAVEVFEEVENTIGYLYKENDIKRCGEFIKSVATNNELKIALLFNGAYLIGD